MKCQDEPSSLESDPARLAEHRDSIEHLQSQGFAPLLAALQDRRNYTAGGRVMLSRLARKMKMSPRRLGKMLSQARACVPDPCI